VGDQLAAMQAPVRERERDFDQQMDGEYDMRETGTRHKYDNRMGSNGNNDLGVRMGAFERSNTHERPQAGHAYGESERIHHRGGAAERHVSAAHANSAPGRGEGLLSQNGVSHSALVNSGNAAILGHNSNLNSLKLNSNNNNFGNGSSSAAHGTYGAVGTIDGRLHGERERLLARD